MRKIIRQEMRFLIRFFFLLIGFMISGQVLSIEDPVQMLNGVTGRVISELKVHREEIHKDHHKIYAVADHLILPYVDLTEMARWVVGRNAWKEADVTTQQAFVREFKILLVGSYAGSLLGYTDQKIEFLPLRSAVENQQRIQVSSLIKDGGKAPLHLDYRLIREGNSWKVYDIIIEGVSLAQGYRAQFAEDVRVGGVSQVVRSMQRHNAR
jgi:phospholipid transport system substrate-binding protein